MANRVYLRDPKDRTHIAEYMVNKDNDPPFLPAYPEDRNQAGIIVQCEKLSPRGLGVAVGPQARSGAPTAAPMAAPKPDYQVPPVAPSLTPEKVPPRAPDMPAPPLAPKPRTT